MCSTRSEQTDRLTMRRLAQGGDPDAFANDVRRGLAARPKALFPKYFYDDLVSKLFEAICRLPEYYLTRAEREILTRHAREIAGSIKAPVRLARQTVPVQAIDLEVSFEEGEMIYTESSYKFDLARLAELARGPGFSLERTWFDDAQRFSFNLFAAVERN